jgi:hypothetical protein
MEVNVGNADKNPFGPKAFLSKVGKGKTILEFHSNQNVFAQGDVTDFNETCRHVRFVPISRHRLGAASGHFQLPV